MRISDWSSDVCSSDLRRSAWSPDGKWIAYQRRDRGVTQLWRVAANGGKAEPVTQSAVDIQAFAWLSNDRIVVASRPGQIAEAAKIDAEGRTGRSEERRVGTEWGGRGQYQRAPYHYQKTPRHREHPRQTLH